MTTLPEEAVTAAASALRWSGDTLTEMATAALTAAAPFLQGVKVKALEWVKPYPNVIKADTVIGRWAIQSSADKWDWWPPQYDDDSFSPKQFDTLEAAKAAAQADFEARILSALEPSAERELALEEAARVCDAKIVSMQAHYDQTDNPFIRSNLAGDIALISHLAAAIRALSSPDHADAGKVEEVKLPAERVCIPDPHNFGARVVGFRIREGDGAWGETGLSEPISWLNKLLTPNAGKVEGDGWLPIESAPKDAYVLAWGDNFHWRGVEKAYVHSDYNGHIGVICRHGVAGTPFSGRDAPTHWRPLPSAPASEGAE